ncbi:TetR/AcrR family transcriptional regulator [Streptomyces sp. NPDC093510]|uniref:TetR/AcrR family transcriptional regulator n=1 Tax=Streptomyces sp. NPDC093510 TaxID=3155199 RepID=UPI00342ED05E
MSTSVRAYPTRARLLDAAEHLLRDRGLAAATTKAIAAGAQCSEAALYKHFTGKGDLLDTLLRERLPMAGPLLSGAVRDEDAEACCVRLARQLVRFYEQSMPLLGALLADRALLPAPRPLPHATAATADELLEAVVRPLHALRERGRIRADADVRAAGALLLGACFQRAAPTQVAPRGRPWSAEEFPAAVGRAVAASLTAVRGAAPHLIAHDNLAEHPAPCKELE